MSSRPTVLLDVDGTLVDTNYHHALAWHRALRAHGHVVQMWKVHRHIGMGGDQIVTALIGEKAAEEEVDHYLDLLAARDLVDDWTTSADVERTKPAADLVCAALEKAPDDAPALMVGDSVAAARPVSPAGDSG